MRRFLHREEGKYNAHSCPISVLGRPFRGLDVSLLISEIKSSLGQNLGENFGILILFLLFIFSYS